MDNGVLAALTKNIQSALIGKSSAAELVIITLLAKGNILIEDVPGVGKTTLATALVRSLDCGVDGFARIQFTPDTLPSDITGVSIYNMATGRFEYTKGAIMKNIILADEINRTSPKTQSALLEAMEEHQITVDGTTYTLPDPFMVIATQNPVEYSGTYNLPEAQLDRFLMRITIGYPSNADELRMIEQNIKSKAVLSLEAVTSTKDIIRMQNEVCEVKVNRDIISYVINIVNETRNSQNLTLGASPRASLAVVRAAQAAAYYAGRDYVIPDDVIKLLPSLLTHRLILSSEARINHLTAEKVLSTIVSGVKVPVFREYK